MSSIFKRPGFGSVRNVINNMHYTLYEQIVQS